MPITAATLARIQELRAGNLATLLAAVEPVGGASNFGGRAGSGAQASLQSAQAAIRAIIVAPPENGIARVLIAGGLVEVQLPADLLRQGLTNPALFRPGATLQLPADIPARPVPAPATLVQVHAPQPGATSATGASVGPAPPLAGAFPPGSLGAAIARLAGIAFPQGEAAGTVIPARGETSPALRPGLVSKPIAPDIAEALLRGAAKQIPLAGAFEALLGAADADTPLPAPLLAALRLLGGLRATPQGLTTPEGLEAAIRASGTFLEGTLARGLAPGGDVKAALLRVRATANAADDTPQRGEIARMAEGAIERVKLGQLASLPEHPEIRVTDDRGQAMRIALQIPIATQGHDRPQTAMLGLVIEHNPFNPEPPAYAIEDREAQSEEEGFPWKIRVSLDLEETGPVQAEIALRGQAIAVTLWAERQGFAGKARGGIGALHAALTEADFEVTRLEVKDGLPHGRLPRSAPMLDRRT